MSGSGWCTHPKRQQNKTIKVLVRKGELACRNSWGDDFWMDASAPIGVDEPEDTLIAGPSTHPAAKPGQLWLPDAPSSNEPTMAKYPEEDTSENEAAHREQEDRAQFMRLSPRDAITRAWARSSERKLGNQTPGAEAAQAESGSDTSGEDEIIAPASTEPTDSDDRGIQRGAKPPDVPKTTIEERDRLVTPHVPVAEVTARPHHADEDKFNDIPEIHPDVELPRLRDQFSVPKHRASASAFITKPAKSSGQSDPGESTISPYELALQRAREFRASTTPSSPDTTQDRVTSTFTQHDSYTPPSEPEGEDEIVDFRAERTSVGSRFSAPVDYIDDIHDDNLEEDFELDRSFRPEETATQTGHRWWHTFGRHRVFRQTPDHDFSAAEVASARSAYDIEPISPSGFADDHLAINWDNASLAPVVPHTREVRSDSELLNNWPSLNYLDDEAGDEPLAPIAWQTPEPSSVVEQSPIADGVSARHQFDPYSREGMDHLRDRLFASSLDARIQSDPVQEPTPSRPFSRTVVSEPSATLQDEILQASSSTSPSREPQFPAPSVDEVAAYNDFEYDSEFNPDFDLRRIVTTKSMPLLDMTIMISPEIPRKCATCRSFRISENGTRGWCTNKWAFAHRPLVDSEDRACETTIGCWWLPGDIDWDRDEFIAELTAPTPRADRLIAAHDREQRRMTS